jgi:DDE superfamily endonuclease/Tc5 transposase DNA-binding domain
MDREDSIQKALQDLETGRLKTVYAAARFHKVPRSTLIYRQNGGQSRRHAHAAQQACSPEEEQALVKWVQRWSSQGFPIPHSMVRAMAKHLILSRISDSRRKTVSTFLTSRNWPTRFIKRYPHLEAMIADTMDRPRHVACMKEIFNKWFSRFYDHYSKYKPDLEDIYNIDETGFSMGESEKAYVIVDRQHKSMGHILEGTKGEWTTVIECVSAAGTAIPPYVIFKGKHIQSNWFQQGAPTDWMIATSPKGWTSNGLALNWLQRHFEPHTRPRNKNKYRFLILDGHGSHLTPEFQEFCEIHCIVLLCLPPHTSHLLQPLDVSVFSSLKHWYRRAIDTRLRLGSSRIMKAEFLQIYAKIHLQALTVSNIQSGFRKTGLVPYNPAAALRQLPTTPIDIPDPVIPQHLQTPKNDLELKKAIAMLENNNTTPTRIGQKLGKAAEIFHAQVTILEAERLSLLAHIKEIEEVVSRKRKRVPGIGPKTIGEVMEVMEEVQPKRATRRRRRLTTPPSDSGSDWSSLDGVMEDDISSCIIAVESE